MYSIIYVYIYICIHTHVIHCEPGGGGGGGGDAPLEAERQLSGAPRPRAGPRGRSRRVGRERLLRRGPLRAAAPELQHGAGRQAPRAGRPGRQRLPPAPRRRAGRPSSGGPRGPGQSSRPSAATHQAGVRRRRRRCSWPSPACSSGGCGP